MPKTEAVDDERMSAAADEESTQRTARIEAEIAQLGEQRSWAGDYYYGDGLGVNVELHIAPLSGFEFEWHGCLGMYDRNWGEVAERGGSLELTFHFPNERAGFHGLDTSFVPVEWGERRYLIPPSKVKRFCNAVNSGEEPRAAAWGSFLLSRAKDETPPSGKPEMPREFAKLVLDTPLVANVVAVKEGVSDPSHGATCRVTVVTLDIGSQNGAWEGMRLFLVDSRYGDSVTITKCDETRCEAEHETDRADAEIPAVGWKLTTRR